MAIEAKIQEDEQVVAEGLGQEPQQATPVQQEGVSQPLGSGGSAFLGEGQPQTQQPQVSPSSGSGPKGSGMGKRLSNLRKYVEAARRAPEQPGLAKGIQEDIEKRRAGISKQATASQQAIQEKAAAEKARIESGRQLVGREEGQGRLFERGRTTQFTQDISPGQQQPEVPLFKQFGETAAERLGEFERFKGADVEKLEFQKQAELERQAKELQKKAELSQSEAGRFQLLRETFGRPGYTTGQQRLDQLILQANPEESKALQEMTAGISKPINEQIESIKTLAQSENADIRAQADQLAANISEQMFGPGGAQIDPRTGQVSDVGGALGQFRERIGGEVSQARELAGQQFEQIGNLIASGQDITTDDLTKLGIKDPKQAQDFLDYYKRGQKRTLAEASQSGDLTSQEFEQIAGLTGQDPEELASVYRGDKIPLEEFKTRIGLDPSLQNVDGLGPTNSLRQSTLNRAFEGNIRLGTRTFDNQRIKNELSRLGVVLSESPTDREIRDAIVVLPAKQLVAFSKNIGSPSPTRATVESYIKANEEAENRYQEYSNQINANRDSVRKQVSDLIARQGLEQYRVGGPDIEFSKYLRDLPPEAISAARVASAEDYARQAALEQLAGLGFGPLQAGQIGQAGTAGEVGVGRFDVGQALGEAREFYNLPETERLARIPTPVDRERKPTGIYRVGEVLPLMAAEKLLLGGGAINDITRKTERIIQDTLKPVNEVVGTYWCTELQKRGMIGQEEVDVLHELMHKVWIGRARGLAWYIDNGQYIVDLANEMGYDWESALELVHDCIEIYEEGNIDLAAEIYEDLAIELTSLVGVKSPPIGKSWKSLLYIPKVVLYHVFRRLR